MKRFRLSPGWFTSVTLVSILVALQSCSSDEGLSSRTDITGMWTLDKFSLELKVDEKDLVEWYQDALGFSEQDALVFTELTMSLTDNYATGGRTEFKLDKTFSTTAPGDHYFIIFTILPDKSLGEELKIPGFPVEGTWDLNPDGKKLIINSNLGEKTIDLRVSSLNTSTMLLTRTDIQLLDLTGDGLDQTVNTTITYSFSTIEK